MFNCNKPSKLSNPVDYHIPGYVNISQLKLRSEKFDDDDDDNNYNDNNNNNNNNKVIC